ncbi:MAG: ribonuclease BN [Bacteroidetes bacterium HGW-Bacteroidetes-11]|jgi:membrane protein|nr:MAG: ribonuclease BN [Bacteroidetes bacterium HGW-Bacteroidetes-11]
METPNAPKASVRGFRSASSKVWYLLKETSSEFIDDNGMKLGAALSYYTIFSLPPLLIIIISLSSIFFGAEAVRGEIFGQINGLVGSDAALQIQEIIKNVKLSHSSKFATALGVGFLLIGASGVFVEIQDSINYIWGIRAKPKRGFVKFLINRLMSFSMIGSVGFLLLVGLIVNSVMDVLSKQLAEFFPKDTVYLFYILNILIVFVIITLLFTVIFKTLPDGKVALRDCVIGASFTTFLFMIGKFGIGAYLSRSVIASWYGATGSVILILVWVYYSAIILYFGAEFTKVYAITHGMKIVPNAYSVQIIKEKIEIEPHRTPKKSKRAKR